MTRKPNQQVRIEDKDSMMDRVDLNHLRYTLGGVLGALRTAPVRIPNPPPAVLASCIIIGHTTRLEVEQLLGAPAWPQDARAKRVAHYVYDNDTREALTSLLIEYFEDGVVRALSAGVAGYNQG